MILVIGATGLLGGMIAQRLLAEGRDVRILVRRNSPSEELAKQGLATSAQTLIDAGAQPVYGDLKEPASLDAACQGIEVLITTANSAMRGGEDNAETVDLKGNRSLIDAAKAAGVKHFVFVSALIADKESPAPLPRAKALTEEHLLSSGIDHTILAPDTYMEVWIGAIVGMPLQMGQPVTLVGEARRKHSFVSMGDVAAFAVASVDDHAAANRYLAIGGPEAVSWRDIVAKCEKAVGQGLPLRFVAPGEPLPGQPEGVAGIMAAMESYDSVVDMAETARSFSVALTPVDVVVGRLFGGAGS
jgi:NADH dehydrogenase